MGFLSTFADYVPGVNTIKNIYEGDWTGAGLSLVPGVSQAYEFAEDMNGQPLGKSWGAPHGWGGGKTLGGRLESMWNGARDAFNAPYEQKARGYDAIRGEVDRLKGERKAQKDYAYQLADSKFEPTRKAISAIYGDPSGWKL